MFSLVVHTLDLNSRADSSTADGARCIFALKSGSLIDGLEFDISDIAAISLIYD